MHIYILADQNTPKPIAVVAASEWHMRTILRRVGRDPETTIISIHPIEQDTAVIIDLHDPISVFTGWFYGEEL